ncbi:hypothetical protein EVAR_52424_1 [Eumeta japonica]|uniref:Uncharacterized protein n=1 Tax=Eumeta variegata TaxID=151549 RepID=A0A4C1YEV6_EUMVA|nr:hypothetical protein EVAR_52424_1 [Eumeta japonica]
MPEWKGRVPLTRSHCERITWNAVTTSPNASGQHTEVLTCPMADSLGDYLGIGCHWTPTWVGSVCSTRHESSPMEWGDMG